MSSGGVGVQTLTQRGRRGHCAQVQSAGEEGIFALAFDGIEIASAQAQQAEGALEDVAVGFYRCAPGRPGPPRH